MLFSLNNRENPLQSGGKGIIRVSTLAQSFQPLEPLSRRLPPPVAQGVALIVQIRDGKDFPIYTRCLCLGRCHGGKVTEAGGDWKSNPSDNPSDNPIPAAGFPQKSLIRR